MSPYMDMGLPPLPQVADQTSSSSRRVLLAAWQTKPEFDLQSGEAGIVTSTVSIGVVDCTDGHRQPLAPGVVDGREDIAGNDVLPRQRVSVTWGQIGVTTGVKLVQGA